ncbi:hypothetical protein PoB_004943800 [Plakobranchus ocellatus]|uniref:Secreted protein n=1 Tax=Plakobranchus ocellatus TaxID=259542 RepID=A0AAV4BVU9_9GAST|nr:hypothetical protein PoB_004943800 [Plakobranchus ocellatus]
MKTSTVLLGVICVLSVHVAVGDRMEDLQNCIQEFSSNMQKVLQQVMSGDASQVKEKMCPMMKDFLKCAMRASSDKRPTDAELEDLKKQMASSMTGMQSVDCDLDVNAIADEVYGAAGIARPMSILALAAAALCALFLSKRM